MPASKTIQIWKSEVWTIFYTRRIIRRLFKNRLFGRVFRLFNFYLFLLKKTCRLLRLFRIFGFQTEYSAEYSDYSIFILSRVNVFLHSTRLRLRPRARKNRSPTPGSPSALRRPIFSHGLFCKNNSLEIKFKLGR